jgi:K(+)-stimulated pyrophosphate-energized sodium pump
MNLSHRVEQEREERDREEFVSLPLQERERLSEANVRRGKYLQGDGEAGAQRYAVVGATTKIFSLILQIKNKLGVEPETILNVLNPYTILVSSAAAR